LFSEDARGVFPFTWPRPPCYSGTGSAFDISIFLGGAVGGSIFVLFVDDDASFANAAARSFESVGMRTLLVLGSWLGIDSFDSNPIDVIITDIKLPAREPQGLALAQMIKNKRPDAPIILMTMHPELLMKDVNPSSAALGAPLEIAELCRAIRVRQTQ
jgi:DNA-binding response OmpR family regulator